MWCKTMAENKRLKELRSIVDIIATHGQHKPFVHEFRGLYADLRFRLQERADVSVEIVVSKIIIGDVTRDMWEFDGRADLQRIINGNTLYGIKVARSDDENVGFEVIPKFDKFTHTTPPEKLQITYENVE